MGIWGGGIGYFIHNPNRYNCKMLFIDMFVGGFVSTIVGFCLWTGNAPPLLIFATCGVSAVFSKEVMRLLRRKMFRVLEDNEEEES